MWPPNLPGRNREVTGLRCTPSEKQPFKGVISLFGGRCQRWRLGIVDKVIPSYEKGFEIDNELEMF
jgi:hypothetical protein